MKPRWMPMRLLVGAFLASFVAGCVAADPSNMPVVTAIAPAGLPNPASVYCEEQGGQVQLRPAYGGQVGVCVFPDGSECEEWAFFRGECLPQAPSPTPAAGTPPATPAGPAEIDQSLEDLRVSLEATLPHRAFEGVSVFPLQAWPERSPLWAAHTVGLRSYDVDPLPSHFIAVFARGEAGWQELARVELDQAIPEGAGAFYSGPDWLEEGSVVQVDIDPAMIWLQASGGVGAHSGTYHLVSFDGEVFRPQVVGFSSRPGLGQVRDVNGDGVGDVLLEAYDHYVFCYACGVRKPDFQVHTWLGDGMAAVDIADLLMGQQGMAYYAPNSRAVRYAGAGLWPQALASVEEAIGLAGDEDPPTGAGSLRWNEALIQLHYDANRREVEQSPYPLLSLVFLGDYAAAVDQMRDFPVGQIFDPETPLIAGTAAEGWEDSVSNYILDSATAAVAVEPDLAEAYFLRAWAEFLANPASPQVRSDLARAGELAPGDDLLAAAANLRLAPEPTAASQGAARRIQFAPGGTSATVSGILFQGQSERYVLRAQAGQSLHASVTALTGDVSVQVAGADGSRLEPQISGPGLWQGELPATQDYVVEVSTAGVGTSYTLVVTIPPGSRE